MSAPAVSVRAVSAARAVKARRIGRAAVLGALLSGLGAAGCADPPEQPLLDQFFRASALYDNTTLENLATVRFDPRAAGIVTAFDIAAVGREERRRLDPPALAAAADFQVPALTPPDDRPGADDPFRRPASQATVVALSLVDARGAAGASALDLAARQGDLVSKTVTVKAPVRRPDGRVEPATLVITMERAVLTGAREIAGRWIITGIVERAG